MYVFDLLDGYFCHVCHFFSLSTLASYPLFSLHTHEPKTMGRDKGLKGMVDERAVALGTYIVENRATVRSTAGKFGVSKSTVHIEVIN